jgi:hypothetical protein
VPAVGDAVPDTIAIWQSPALDDHHLGDRRGGPALLVNDGLILVYAQGAVLTRLETETQWLLERRQQRIRATRAGRNEAGARVAAEGEPVVGLAVEVGTALLP